MREIYGKDIYPSGPNFSKESDMQLELTREEARVIDLAFEYIKRHKDVALKIYPAYEDALHTI